MTSTIDLERYNVTWDSPSADSTGSMPIGNGEIGLNVWVEPRGDLLFYIARTDAWDQNMRLVKLGRVRVVLSPNPLAAGASFQQTLDLRQGEITIGFGGGLRLRVWVDAHAPVIHVECDGDQAVALSATLELWRTSQRPLPETELNYSDAYHGGLDGQGSSLATIEYPDTIVPGLRDRVAWYHHNQHSPWRTTLALQSLDALIDGGVDPLLDRTFGAMMWGPNMVAADARTLSGPPARRHHVQIRTATAHPATPRQWLQQIERDVALDAQRDVQAIRRQHRAWWDEFWHRSWIDIRGSQEAFDVTQAYVLQRFISACAGRGSFPIKFNGSLFNVDARTDKGQFNADWRRWGGAYWFQNTRLAYWPMLAAGDFDLMRPLFNMYRQSLDLATHRVRRYYGHGGAVFPETMYFFGAYHNGDYGWNRSGLAPGFVTNPYVRYYWSSNLELSTMMLDYFDFTADEGWARATMLPLVEAIVTFFDEHWPRDGAGKIRFDPAAALETWHEAVNPLPEIAGLRFILPRLLALPSHLLSEAQRSRWQRLLQELPAIPVGQKDGRDVLMPAEQFTAKKNVENPELYAVFPYRHYGVSRPGLELARQTFAVRANRMNMGWCQDAIHAACLGLADEARDMLVARARNKDKDSRFPAFWGPNFDWIPDQDHGCSLQIALQYMLLQSDGDGVLLLPAWPRDWEVDFKLHAPRQTTVWAQVRGGEVAVLAVDPAGRGPAVARP